MSFRLNLAFLTISFAALSSAGTYDAEAEFDGTSPTFGPWTVGYDDGSGFVPFTNAQALTSGPMKGFAHTGTMTKNTGTTDYNWYKGVVIPAGWMITHPWTGEDTIVRWTAPTTYTQPVTLGGVAQMYDFDGGAGRSNLVGIYYNGVLQGSWTALYSDHSVFSFSGSLSNVQAGDTIDFVSRVNPLDYNAMHIAPTVTSVPEPASISALGLGALGLLKRRKKA